MGPRATAAGFLSGFVEPSVSSTTRVSDGHQPRTPNVSKSVHKSKFVVTETLVAVRSTQLVRGVVHSRIDAAFVCLGSRCVT